MTDTLQEQLSVDVDSTAMSLGLDSLDGGQAAEEVGQTLQDEELVRSFTFDSERRDGHNRFSLLLTERDSEERFGLTIATLSGYMVYAMRLRAGGQAVIRAALVSGQLNGTPVLNIQELLDNNMSPVGVDNQQLVLSGIAQFGAPSIASPESHERVKKVGGEAGHLFTAFGGVLVKGVGDKIDQGTDVVHNLKAGGNLVTTFRDLAALPPLEDSFTYDQWRGSGVRLVWPLAEVEHFGRGPRRTDVSDAIPLTNVQAYRKIKEMDMSDRAKQLMEGTIPGY